VIGVATNNQVERCEVLSRHFARIAERSHAVRRIREMLFDDPTAKVGPQEAFGLLASPALRLMTFELFKQRTIPVRWHRSVVTRSKRTHDVELTIWQEFEIQLLWPGGSTLEIVRVCRHNTRTGEGPRFVQFPQREGPARRVDVFHGSLFWAMALECDQIRTDSWWSEPETIWFMLTGTIPPMRPVSAEPKVFYDENMNPVLKMISMQTFLFVSARTTSRAQAQLRRMFGELPLPRAMQARTLRLFDFVEERRSDRTETPEWSRLMGEWNHEVPKWRYSHRGHFRRDYLRARRLLLETDNTFE
jgi:hypothetical protein